jgi:hypothetical protein
LWTTRSQRRWPIAKLLIGRRGFGVWLTLSPGFIEGVNLLEKFGWSFDINPNQPKPLTSGFGTKQPIRNVRFHVRF